MADLTPEQIATRIKIRARAAAAAAGKTTPPAEESSFWNNLLNDGGNIASNLGTLGKNIAKNPIEGVRPISDMVFGIPEATMRYVAPDTTKKIDELNNWLAEQTSLVTKVPVGENSSGAAAAAQVGGSIYNHIRHPIDSFYKEPISTSLDWLPAAGIVGKIPGAVQKAATASKTVGEVIDISKAAKDAAFARTARHPTIQYLNQFKAEAQRGATSQRYNPNLAGFERSKPAVDNLYNYPSTGTLNDVHQMRQDTNLVNNRPSVSLSNDAKDVARADNIARAMREAIDNHLELTDPAGFALLKETFAKNVAFENTNYISDIMKAGLDKGALAKSKADAIAKEVSKALMDKEGSKGLGADTAASMDDIVKMAKSDDIGTIVRDAASSSAPQIGAGAGGAIGGWMGVLPGYAVGKVYSKISDSIRTGRTARNMSNELLKIIHDINNVPLTPGRMGVGLKNLSPATRKLLGIMPLLSSRGERGGR